MKVLFVAMDRGGYPGKPFDLASTQRDFRCAATCPGNPHMGGVHLILREFVDDKDPETFATQFALTNAVKCRKHSSTMRATCPTKIVENCAEHLRAEIEVLKPSMIVTQGDHPTSTVRNFEPFRDRRPIARFTNKHARKPRKAEIYYSEGCILLTTPHPTRLKGMKWRKGQLPRFLAAAIKRIRRDIAKGTVINANTRNH